MENWFKNLATVIIIIIIIILSTLQTISGSEDVFDSKDLQSSGDRLMVFVSNLDGSLTALDGQKGDIQWTIPTGEKPLIVSSISDIQMIRNGLPSRLVPSLDGCLYQIDGEGIEPIPLAADLLLTSTYKLSDESSIVGGKEIETLGIEVDSGNLRYTCSSDGCHQMSELEEGTMNGSNEVMLVKRTDRTIRLVDIIEGYEKWNFSVGQLDLSYHVRSQPFHTITGESTHEVNDAGKPADTSQTFHPRFSYLNSNDIIIKINLPTKTLFAVKRDNPTHIYWEHQFDSSIAGAWMLKDHELFPISLFDNHGFEEGGEHIGRGMMYIGMHNEMLYIQPSDKPLPYQVADGDDNDDNDDDDEDDDDDDYETRIDGVSSKEIQIYMPRVRWKPYIATALSRTPIISNHKLWNTNISVNKDIIKALPNSMDKTLLSKDQYPFDSGYYLYIDNTPIEDFGSCLNVSTSKKSKRLQFISALSRKWKEASLFLLIGVTSLLTFLKKKLRIKLKSIPQKSHTKTSKSCSAQYDPPVPEIELKREISKEEIPEASQQFVSRYLTDFQQDECLGKGGFGVVFKAYNKIDECFYAIKRISLKDSKTARDKVMREVKALAKLDHSGIVRYYQSWLECPPVGWQERHDSLYCRSESIETDMSLTSTSNFVPEVQKNGIQILNCPKKEVTESDESIVFADDVRIDMSYRDDDGDYDISDDSVEVMMKEDSQGSESLGTFEINDSNSAESDSIVFEGSESFCMIVGSSHDSLHRRNIASSGSSIEFLQNNSSLHSEKQIKSENNKINNGPTTTSQSRKQLKQILQQEDKLSTDHEVPRKLYLYIQMQLCKTESLREWLNDQPFEIDVTYDIFYQIVSAISYVHAQGLMHRDLKPSNIFFAMDGTIKIGDFGLVTDVDNICANIIPENADDRYNRVKKHTNQVGTQLYMSPELSSGQNYTQKVDIYALGIIFFEMFQRFSTAMERMKTLQDLRQLKFPDSFVTNFKEEHMFVTPLLSPDPMNRPEACDLLKHKLLSDHEETSNLFRRLHRTRTLSMHSYSSSPGVSSLTS